MCNNCIHKAVCSKYIACGEVKSCEHYDKNRLLYAMECVVWYDCHYMWLKELCDKLAAHPNEFYPMPDMEWHTEQHTIWMLLVGMFGEWGTSIRSGWIDQIPECIAFINNMCKEMWEEDSTVGLI